MEASFFESAKAKEKRYYKYLIVIILIWFLMIKMISNFVLSSSNIKITAHRGSTIFSPENTIPSIVEAIALNVDFIEIDVQLSKDDKVVLLHDRTFNRVGNVNKSPKDLVYDEIKQINVGSYKSNIAFVSAPLLEEVIDVCKLTNTNLLIELKEYSKENLPEEVIKTIREKDYIDKCYIQSFSTQMVKKVKELEPNLKVGLLTFSPALITYMQNDYLDFFSVYYLSITPQIEMYLRSNNKLLFCYTPSSELEINIAINSGTKNIITNNVELTKLLILTKQKK